MAGLLKYFHREPKQKLPVLPDPRGSLSSEEVPSSSLELMNNIIHNVCDKKTTPHGGKHGEYLSLTSAQKFSIGKRAAENGVTATIRTILCQSLS